MSYFRSIANLLMFTAITVIALLTLSSSKEGSRSDSFLTSLEETFDQFFEEAQAEYVYLHFDKTLYRPGETIWFAAYLRNGTDHRASKISDVLNVELIDPKGNISIAYKLVVKDGVAQGDFELATNRPGGLYKVKAYTNWQKNEPNGYVFEKELQVQNVVLPRLKMKLDFQREAYGSGDIVKAELELMTNEKSPLTNHPFDLAVSIDGEVVINREGVTDENGESILEFNLPEDLSSNDAVLNVVLDYEGLAESISRSIPIILNRIDLQFFPEGGYVLNGYNNRIGFQAYNEFGKPADIEGTVVDQYGSEIVRISSFHQGIGAFDLTPENEKRYAVRITQPKGVEEMYYLPEAQERGFALRTENGAASIDLTIHSTESETLSIVGQVRGKMYYKTTVNAVRGPNEIRVVTKDFPGGVAQFTVFDGKGIPRCERLVYVNKDKQLNIVIQTNKEKYQPREEVDMTIKVTDERGLPMPGNFSLSVVDDNLLSFADDQSGNILSELLLQPDVTGTIVEPSFYFDPEEEKADQALDYLLLTSGWRRYAWKQIQDLEVPDQQFPPEKAIIAGVVINGHTQKPVDKATIVIKDRDVSAQTGPDGRFSFKGIDISEETLMEISAKGLNALFQPVIEYDQNMTLTMYSVVVRPNAWNMAPEMMAVQADRIGVVKQKRANVQVEEFEIIDQLDRDGVEIDQDQEIPDLQLGNEDPANDDVEGLYEFDEADIVDARGELLDEWKPEPQDPNKLKSKYYRAKEFAAPVYDKKKPSARSDFRSTVYWNGSIKTQNDGLAKVTFYNSDAITSFRTIVEGIGTDGTIGRAEYVHYTQLPFSIASKLPVEVVSGDRLVVPVILKNNTDQRISGKLMFAIPEGLEAAKNPAENQVIEANQTKTIYREFQVVSSDGGGKLSVHFESDKQQDGIEQELSILPRGFPARLSFSGRDKDKEFVARITNPLQGSISARLTAYPSIMSELLSGVESILREPHGCFEQTSSSNYPNVMVMRYLKAAEIDDPEVEKRAMDFLDKGYDRLISYESAGNGYEWFGADPGHEALTAYGIVQFTDMKEVYGKVEQPMIDRTVNWLLSKRDGNGGFKKNPKALDSFGRADEDITNAYIVYSLTEAGYKDIRKELDAAYENAKSSRDPYQLALTSIAFYNVNEEKRANELLNTLLELQAEDGSWTGAKHSITRSTGHSLKVETTSFAVLALIKSSGRDIKAMNNGVSFIINSRTGQGGFGSTQATVLALKALTAFSLFSKQTDEPGTIEVFVDGKRVKTYNYEAGERDAIAIEGLEAYLDEGAHKIRVRFKDVKNPLPYEMSVSWTTDLPESSRECPVTLKTALGSSTVGTGETVRLSSTLTNTTSDGLPMTMAIIGLPAGMTAQPWQLKELKEKGALDFYETIGNNVVVYFREMKPSEVRNINLDLKAELPGIYEAPASSAYLYYTNEHKYWTSLSRVQINQ